MVVFTIRCKENICFWEGAATIQEVVWAVSIVLMGALAAVFAWVAAGANVALADDGPVVDSPIACAPGYSHWSSSSLLRSRIKL
jgi:hypothetical protein